MSERQAIVLAAGKGTRMQTGDEQPLPKVLYPVQGRPMIHFVLDALREAEVADIAVVVGYESDQVRHALRELPGIDFVEQTEQKGTGHAVQVCRPWLARHQGPVLVVAGDSPMLQSESVGRLFEEFESVQPACMLGTLNKEDPEGLGRIVRDESGAFQAIVEEADATPEQRAIQEVNMSTYLFDCRELERVVGLLSNENRQREYYLTDAPGILRIEGKEVHALPVLKPCEALSINTADELALVEREMRRLAG